jgi:hypothetical protein
MRNVSDAELTSRIRAFIDKKSAKFPELRYPRMIAPYSVTRRTQFHGFGRLHTIA